MYVYIVFTNVVLARTDNEKARQAPGLLLLIVLYIYMDFLNGERNNKKKYDEVNFVL